MVCIHICVYICIYIYCTDSDSRPVGATRFYRQPCGDMVEETVQKKNQGCYSPRSGLIVQPEPSIVQYSTVEYSIVS